MLDTPSVALTTTITLDGEERVLKYGLLAFKALGLNPFDPASVVQFNARPLDLGMVSELIHAGLLHDYHGRAATRRGQKPPTPDDLLADYELDPFIEACKGILTLLKADADEALPPGEKTEPANPPNA